MKENRHSSTRRTAAKASKPEAASKKAKPAASTTEKMAAAEKPKKTTKPQKPSPISVPAILLESEQAPATPAPRGPGQRYSLGPTPPTAHAPEVEAELPESYGTRELFLTARDPHWLYAAWDLSAGQIREYNTLSVDGHLVLKVFKNSFEEEALLQIHVHPESRNWFVPVAKAATKYLAELGYYPPEGKWVGVTKSGATLTPPDSLAEDTSVRFATIESEVPFKELLGLVKSAVREHMPLVEALQQLRAEGYANLPGPAEAASGKWTAAQEKAMGQVVSMDNVRRVWVGSLEITELIRRQLQAQISSMSLGQLSSPFGAISSVSSVSSPFGKMERRKGFWFNVNAELIIYGATEPDAKVTIGGRPIKLRPDGGFSFRFALPDGEFSLPAVAVSAEGDDSRLAALKFSRATQYEGEVGKHPQDPALKPPLVSAVS